MIRNHTEVPFCSGADVDADAGGGVNFAAGRGIDLSGAALDVLNIDMEP
jgi:hypothetical protein